MLARAVCILALLASPTEIYLAANKTATQTLSASISAIGKLSVPASATLTGGGPTFPSFTASVTVSYRIRTTPSGSGSITGQVTSNFSPAGGPSAAAGDLT